MLDLSPGRQVGLVVVRCVGPGSVDAARILRLPVETLVGCLVQELDDGVPGGGHVVAGHVVQVVNLTRLLRGRDGTATSIVTEVPVRNPLTGRRPRLPTPSSRTTSTAWRDAGTAPSSTSRPEALCLARWHLTR
ncbi:hypothetical protein M3148_03765 [Georgenia satyanarayanai]|uniref:hypothetical protein n=1 Tax=Georgenia satyanarayanai TaxID=860221 RepID=UPI00203EDC66|nr:hypothetical protein [Georgenia satyanarayanai]MCM3660113.1 hypothetical protein [Georgenia satyanarayanai]